MACASTYFTVKPVYNGHSQTDQKWFSGLFLLNAGRKYCRMRQEEHSAILSTPIKLLFVIEVFVMPIFSGRFTQVLP